MKVLIATISLIMMTVIPAWSDTTPPIKRLLLFPEDYLGQAIVVRHATIKDIRHTWNRWRDLHIDHPIQKLIVSAEGEHLDVLIEPAMAKALASYIGYRANLTLGMYLTHNIMSSTNQAHWYTERVEIVGTDQRVIATIAIPAQSLPAIAAQRMADWEAATTPAPAPTSATPSDIDQQLATLTIPEVAPVESIHKRLQLIQVQSSRGTGNAPKQPSPAENHYLALVKEAIDQRWIAPPVLDNNPSVIVTFRIEQSGEISQIRIEQGSGNMYYDQAILRAIHQANPLPKFPSALKEAFMVPKFLFTKFER